MQIFPLFKEEDDDHPLRALLPHQAWKIKHPPPLPPGLDERLVYSLPLPMVCLFWRTAKEGMAFSSSPPFHKKRRAAALPEHPETDGG